MKYTIQYISYCLVFTAVLLLFTQERSNAQLGHITSRNMALGGGGTAYMDGYHANFINPANLLLNYDKRTNVEIGLLGGISASAGGTLANISVYNEFFTNDLVLRGQIADDALNGLFGSNNKEIKNVGLNADVIPLGIRIQRPKWSFSAAGRSRILSNFGINRGVGKLLLKGINSEDFGTATPVNFTAETFLVSEISVGVARQFLDVDLPLLAKNVKLFVGVAPKLLYGMNYNRIDFNSTLQVQETSPGRFRYLHDFEYNLQVTGDPSDQLRGFAAANNPPNDTEQFDEFFNPEGDDFSGLEDVGFGLDLGVTMEIELDNFPILGSKKHPNFLRVGASITDIGSVTFDQSGSFTNRNVFDWRGVENLDFERIEDEFNDDTGDFLNFVFADSIGNGIYSDFQPDGDGEVKAELPTRFNIGGLLQLGKLGLSADITSSFRDVGFTEDETAFALGAEYRLFNFIPLRAGIRTGGVASTVYSVGTGLDFRRLTFTVAVSSTGTDPTNGSTLGGAWSGLVLRF